MNKKLIFRIFGSIASALIIVSLFIPYVSAYGNSQNIWEMYWSSNSSYLPIMILIFGAIGVVFFALNIKTEFAYMSSGAILFYSIIQTFEAVNANSFEYLSIGYYCLFIGAVLTGLMAFLANLKSKKRIEEVQTSSISEQPQVSEQVDKLYNQQENIDLNQTKQINNEINPSPVQPSPVQVESPQVLQPINNADIQPINPTVIEEPVVQRPVVNPLYPKQPVNPAIQRFTISQHVPSLNEQPVQQPEVQPVSPSPVIQQPKVESQSVDIFGQPMNK